MEVEEPKQYEFEVTLAGTVLWIVALVVLRLFFHDDLHRHHAEWWYGACGAGVVLGGYGMYRALKRRKS